MKQLARNALSAQNACNLSGIVISFATDIQTLRQLLEAEGKGDTDTINKHPMCILYSTQIAFLTGTSALGCEIDEWRKANEWAENTVKE
jgi:hypothetical protein